MQEKAQDQFSDAVVVRSPMHLDGEVKDQDRAFWSSVMSTACVSDGVTSSPFSHDGAEIVSCFSPVLFKDANRLTDNLRVLADLLMFKRSEALRLPVQIDPDRPLAMQTMLREVAQENLARSYQTTLVAACFVWVDNTVLASVVSVGDSAFFAFSSDGELLATSLPNPTSKDGDITISPRDIRLGPGDVILAKVVFDTAKDPSLVSRVGIPIKSAGNWLVCRPLDQIHRSSTHCSKDGCVLWLGSDEQLFVPKYLAEMASDPKYRNYRWIRYSKVLRTLKSPRPQPVMQDKSNLTAVMPDHFYSGDWQNFQERFPPDAQFVLASDGFYSCFSTPRELWLWLNSNRSELCQHGDKSPAVSGLHHRLQASSGDDDVSFVWVEACPRPGGDDRVD